MKEDEATPGDTRPTVTNSTFSRNNTYALSTNLTSFPALSSNVFTDNGTNGMEIRGGTTTANGSWDQTSVTYIVTGDITVERNTTLALAPGLIVKFIGDGPGSTSCGDTRNQRNLFVKGTLIADGMADSPIYFTSLRDDTVGGDTNNDGTDTVPEPGNWGRVEMFGSSSGSILLSLIKLCHRFVS